MHTQLGAALQDQLLGYCATLTGVVLPDRRARGRGLPALGRGLQGGADPAR